MIREDRKSTLIENAERLAEEMLSHMMKTQLKSGGANELKRILNYCLRSDKTLEDMQNLLNASPPRSTGGIKKIWDIMRDIVPKYSKCFKDKEEFTFILGWAVRILKYEEVKLKEEEERNKNIKKKNKFYK